MRKKQSDTGRIDGDTLVIRADGARPPTPGVRTALDRAAQDPGVRAVVLILGPRSGVEADADLVAALAAGSKPVIAAMEGRVPGGGLDIALAATARIAAAGAVLGLPDIRLGLVPGCGGIERLTRLTGVEAALDLCLSGREAGAEEALALGLIDAVATDDLVQEAVALARRGIAPRPARPDPEARRKIAAWRDRHGFRLRGQAAPAEALALIEAAATDPGLAPGPASRAARQRLEQGPQSAALRHLAEAERRVGDLPFLGPDTPALAVETVGVVGAGTMGSGIATALLMAGLRVALHDSDTEGLARGRTVIARNLSGAVRRGKLTEAARAAALARLRPAEGLEPLAEADLIIEAIHESLPEKRQLFARLDRLARPGTILASNTSFLDIDTMAAATARPERVLGMHFFSPAHVMRLLEVVRGARTGPEAVATAMALGRRIGKIAVCVGNCHGFVGNRILLPRQQAAMRLLLQGADPYRIDRAMVDFGLPMGPFEMADLAGLDVGWDRAGSAGRSIEEVFCEAGRFGRKNGRGYYDHDADGTPRPSPEALALIARFRAAKGIPQGPDLSPGQILERLLTPMLEETRRIIDEGIAIRASDIDVIWVHGYGWPAWRGGPAWYLRNAASAHPPKADPL